MSTTKPLMPMDGEFKKQSDYYSSDASYGFRVKFNPALEAIRKERQQALEKVADCEKQLLEYMRTAFAYPPNFSVNSAKVDWEGVWVETSITGIHFKSAKVDNSAAKAPTLPWHKRIAQHPNLIQILNSGALNKDEKRKVLGLPKAGSTEGK